MPNAAFLSKAAVFEGYAGQVWFYILHTVYK